MVLIEILFTLAIISVLVFLLFKVSNLIINTGLIIIIILLILFLIFNVNILFETIKGPIQGEVNDNFDLTEEECRKIGGDYGRHGIAQNLYCNPPTSDGGNICNKSDECEGLCMLSDDGKGYCQKYKYQFGCFSALQTDGVIALCVD
ncbi:MAG: hypothetical protein AABW49_04180 [Nanoarchaeota archaeon]|mgnify:CR=1 FL=1